MKIILNSRHPLKLIYHYTTLKSFNHSQRARYFILKQHTTQEELQLFSLSEVLFDLLLNLNGHFKTMQQKLNIFQFNVKLFNISGIIPSENVNSSLWKSALFRIFQILSLLLVLSMITLQSLAIYHYWGNINLVADSFGLLSAIIDVCFIAFYTIINWKSICEVIDTFETNSIFCSELVRSNQKHMKILNETLNLAQLYKKVISISMFIVPIFFVLPTFVQHLMTSGEEMLQEVESVDGFTKYFIFVVWLPPVLKQEFIIRVIYGLQCICFWQIFLFSSAIAPLYSVLYLYTGTQFKLISSIIREMDEVMCRVENPGNILHEVPEQPFTTDSKKISDSIQSPMSNDPPLKSNLHIEEPTALSNQRILSSKIQQNVLQEDDIIRESERIHDISSPEIKSTTNIDPENFYLVECIKLHQASIK